MKNAPTKPDMKTVLSQLVSLLDEYEDGEATTLIRMLEQLGYDTNEFDHLELMEILDSFIDEALKRKGVILGAFAHRGKEVGMPYLLDFMIRKNVTIDA